MTDSILQLQIEKLRQALSDLGLSSVEQEKKLTEILLQVFEEIGEEWESELTEEEKELVDEEIKDNQIDPLKLLAALSKSEGEIRERFRAKIDKLLAGGISA